MEYDPHKSFPYPVLRPNSDDYLGVDYQTTVQLTVSKDKVSAQVHHQISSPDIVAQIQNGNAQYFCLFSCRDTYYRKAVQSYTSTHVQEFEIADLRGEIRVDPYVVVRKPIAHFNSPDINPEFNRDQISYNPGDILAQDEAQVFFIDRDMFKPVTSVFDLVKKDDVNDGEWTLGFDQDHVQIGVSPGMKQAIDNARNSREKKVVLLNSLYFAAVMETLQRLKDSTDEYSGRKWAEIIQRQAHNKGLDLTTEDAYVLAQKLMQSPLMQLKSVFEG